MTTLAHVPGVSIGKEQLDFCSWCSRSTLAGASRNGHVIETHFSQARSYQGHSTRSGENDSQSSFLASQEITPTASFYPNNGASVKEAKESASHGAVALTREKKPRFVKQIKPM